MKKSDIDVQMWPIENLIPYELNAKKHDPDQVSRIAKSIERFGWDQPIVVDRHGVIIKGHGRHLAAIDLGRTHVPVLQRKDLSPEEVQAARLADNRVAISDIDPEKLRADLDSLGLGVDQLEGIFLDKELDFMDADLGSMNPEVFVTDMDKTVSDQKVDLDNRMDVAAKTPVPIHKAFGFKTVPGGGHLTLTQFMAICEAKTGLQAGDALVKFVGERIGAFEEML